MSLLTGPVKDWLESNREALNLRFRAARKRFPKIDAQGTLDAVAELLPPFADVPESSALLHELYDLILLHGGRGLLAGETAQRVLLAETFPKLKIQLAARPALLPGSLSNAVENLGARGKEFAQRLSKLSSRLNSIEQTLDAGTLLAWRLGEARLRKQALDVASKLPEAVTLETLDLAGWPERATPLAVAALLGDAWRHPRERLSAQTLAGLERMPREQFVALIEKLSGPATMPLANWRPCGSVGEFAGFGGTFTRAPKLLNPGKISTRNRFWVRSGETHFQIDADLFGWVCKPDSAADFPAQESPGSAGVFKSLGLSLSGGKQMLLKDGTLYANNESATFGALKGASSFNIWPDAVAAALDDSHRIRVYAAVRPAL